MTATEGLARLKSGEIIGIACDYPPFDYFWHDPILRAYCQHEDCYCVDGDEYTEAEFLQEPLKNNMRNFRRIKADYTIEHSP